MNNKPSLLPSIMLWATLPLMSGLYYWEYMQRLPGSSLKVLQILVLPVALGWAYFWNKQSELERLRYGKSVRPIKRITHYMLITSTRSEDDPTPGCTEIPSSDWPAVNSDDQKEVLNIKVYPRKDDGYARHN